MVTHMHGNSQVQSVLPHGNHAGLCVSPALPWCVRASPLHCPGVYDIVSWVKLPKVLTDSQFLPCLSLAELWESSQWGEIPTIVMDLPLKNLESSE